MLERRVSRSHTPLSFWTTPASLHEQRQSWVPTILLQKLQVWEDSSCCDPTLCFNEL